MASADELIKQFGYLRDHRTNFETQWQEVAERVWPERSTFTTQTITPGEKKTQEMFDSTAALAMPKFAAAMDSMLTPRTQRWHKLIHPDDNINANLAVKRWLEQVNEVLWRARYSPKANFAGQQSEVYMGIGAFGTGCMFIDDVVGVGIRYKSCHLSEIYFAENWYGKVDKVFRRFQMTARQQVQAFGERASTKAKLAMEKSPESIYWVIHCVKPADEDDMKMKRRGMVFESYYVCEESKEIIGEGGYRTMPYIVYRHITTPGETYGRGPAMMVLPAIKMSNEIKKTMIRAGHLATRPPLLLPADGALSAFNLRPDALNFGGLDMNGQERVKPLNINANLQYGDSMLQDERQAINDAFLINLFQILVEQPNMTATEAMIRAQEKGQLLTPTMGRHQSEGLGPHIERELDILAHAGVLPPMPDELLEAGGELTIEYTAPLNRLQRSEDGVAIMRTLEQLTPLAQIDPGVLDIFDPELIARELSDINGVPAKVLRSKEQIAQIDEQKQQAATAQQMLQAAPVIANSAKGLMQAQQIAQQSGQSVIPA